MSEDIRQPKPVHAFLAADEEDRLLDLLDYLEDKIPAAYRAAVLSFLLPRAITDARVLTEPGAPSVVDRDGHLKGPAAGSHGDKEKEEGISSLEAYHTLVARRGDTLLKALASLRFAETQLGIRWLTPTEIVRLLGDLDDDHHVYRSNVSNVLRKEESLVARRPRGRGYEYGLTRPGRARVMRELSLMRIDPRSEGSGFAE